MKSKSKITLTALLILFVALTRGEAQFTYNAIDLGTLGGPTSTASAIDPAGQVAGFSLAADGSAHAYFYTNGTMRDLGNLGGAGMIDPTTGNQNGALGTNIRGEVVGFGAMEDGSLHAFLYADSQMVDLNAMADLSAGGFKVLTVAKAINDYGLIVGDGIMNTGDRHAFLLVPIGAATNVQGGPAVIPTKGGQWSYANDRWVWAASDGGWAYSGGDWQWNGPGSPPHHHPRTPPPPPPISVHTPFLTPIYGKTPVTSQLTPKLAPPPPPLTSRKTPFLTPAIGNASPIISKLTPPASTQPPTFNKTPFLTPAIGNASPIVSKLTPPAPTQPPTFNKSPFLSPAIGNASPIASKLTPPAPSPAPSVGNQPPVGGTPPPSALPSQTPQPSATPSPQPSASPKHHHAPTKKATPTPSPRAHTATATAHKSSSTPSPHPKSSPTPEGEHHHHNPH